MSESDVPSIPSVEPPKGPQVEEDQKYALYIPKAAFSHFYRWGFVITVAFMLFRIWTGQATKSYVLKEIAKLEKLVKKQSERIKELETGQSSRTIQQTGNNIRIGQVERAIVRLQQWKDRQDRQTRKTGR